MLFNLLLLSAVIQSFTMTELRTLRQAKESFELSQQLAAVRQQCPQVDFAALDGVQLPDEALLPSLLQQKLAVPPAEFALLLQQDALLQSLSSSENALPACDETSQLQMLLDELQTQLTALDMAQPMLGWQQKLQPQSQTPRKQLTEALLAKSHAVVIAAVVPRAELTAVQQADYLHIDYHSDFVFRLEQGWRAVAPRYLGMHINLSQQHAQHQPQRWVLLLDHKFHLLKAWPWSEVQAELSALGVADWSFNRQGDLQRREADGAG